MVALMTPKRMPVVTATQAAMISSITNCVSSWPPLSP